jgi:hypothetical protein
MKSYTYGAQGIMDFMGTSKSVFKIVYFSGTKMIDKIPCEWHYQVDQQRNGGIDK